jgi:hypothetical protein
MGTRRLRKDRRFGVGLVGPAVGALAVALLIAGVAVSAAGCGLIKVGPTQELAVDEPLGGAAVTDVQVTLGAGKLSVSPGSGGLVSGVIRYNVASWKPTVSRTDSSVIIKQANRKGVAIGGGIVNDWQLHLGGAPMRLSVSAGPYEGSYDLSGLVLQGLTIKDGAAKTQVKFDSPNPGQMDRLLYETGASKVTLTGLANANFKNMEFKGGAGSYTLDFSGQLRTDASVRVRAGVGAMRIVVPAQTAARVTIQGSLTDVSVEGSWAGGGKTYSTPPTGAQARVLTIMVDMSVGSLKLATE